MVTTLHIKCPHCKQASQIFLSTSVSVIILNCPSCLSPIMYFKRKVVLLDSPVPARNGEESCCVDAVPLLEKKAKAEVAGRSMVEKAAGAIECSDREALPDSLTGDGQREKYITEDDCTNLRIELELCADSKYFIDHL